MVATTFAIIVPWSSALSSDLCDGAFVPLLYDLAGFGQVGELLVLVARVANDEPEQMAVGAAVADIEGQAAFRARKTAGLKVLPDEIAAFFRATFAPPSATP
jgi:hypothetical protein